MLRSGEEPLPFGAIRSQVERTAAYRTCLHPDASADECGGVISAHTLQRSRVLRAISSPDNHVMSFYPVNWDDRGKLKAERRGWKRAAIFEAFCAVHDSEAFAALEKEPFQASALQIFLIAYRAVCWELYQKVRGTRASPVVRGLLDRGMNARSQREVQSLLRAQSDGFERGRAEAQRVKSSMDAALVARDFGNYRMVEVLVGGPTSVVATGAITPNRTIGGNSLQVLHDPSRPSEWLAFGVDVSERGTSVVFLWVRDELSPTLYMKQVLALPDPELLAFLPQFFFAHCENTYFAEVWWTGLPKEDRNLLSGLMSNSNPYYFRPDYDLNRRVTDWTLLSKREVSTT